MHRRFQAFYLQEVDNLAAELRFLKGCQLRYFLFSITAAGAVLSVLSALMAESCNDAENGRALGYAALTPLLIILPCWWIFFDKATTITRIVGYLRVSSERFKAGIDFWCGWENSLAEFRRLQEHTVWNYFKGFRYCYIAIPFFTTQKYWALNFLAFSVLSLACILASCILSPKSDIVFNAALFLVLISFFHNIAILGRLTNGDYSYKNAYKLWSRAI